MAKFKKLVSMYRSYRRDGFPIGHSLKGAILWSGVLGVD